MSEGVIDISGRGSSALDASDELLVGGLRLVSGDYYVANSLDELEAAVRRQPSNTLAAVGAIATTEATPQEVIDDSGDVPNILPPTTLDQEYVKDVVLERSGTSFEDRVESLLTHAWEASSVVERAVPSELVAFTAPDPSGWYRINSSRVFKLLEERTDLPDIYDQTDPYEATSPFLRNAVTIHDIADNRAKRQLGLHVELSARLILLHAAELKNNS